MKKLILFFSVMVALGVTTSCSQDGDTVIDPQPASRSLADLTTVLPDTSSVITPTRAMEIAGYLGKAAPASRAASRVAESVEAVTDENGDPLIYVVNYTNDQGYVVLSATTAYTPILAQSDEGRFDLADLDQNHPVNFWLDEQKYIVKHADALPDSIRRKVASEWMAYNFDRADVAPLSANADRPQVYYDSLRRWSLDPNIDVYTYEDYIQTSEYQNLSQSEKNQITAGLSYYGDGDLEGMTNNTLVLKANVYSNTKTQLLTTLWNQGYPYNEFVPNKKDLGCTVIASGQIMKYHKKPSTYNWNNMPDDDATTDTQSFLYNLGRAIGIDYTADKSASNIKHVNKTLQDYGYKTTFKSSHDVSAILSEVRNNRPVYLRGLWNNKGDEIGHAWVCDGYNETTTMTKIRFMTVDNRIFASQDMMAEAYSTGSNNYTNMTFHYNWGGDKSLNGYFRDDNISFVFKGEIHNYNIDRMELLIQP